MKEMSKYAKVVREAITEMKKAGRWLIPAAASVPHANDSEVTVENRRRAIDFLGGAATIAIARANLSDISNEEIDAHVVREARAICDECGPNTVRLSLDQLYLVKALLDERYALAVDERLKRDIALVVTEIQRGIDAEEMARDVGDKDS